MKKIMFSDRYGLTQAVLSGRKTMTRRLIPTNLCACTDFSENPPMFHDSDFDWHHLTKAACAFKVGEIVAIAQSYKDAGVTYIPCEDDEFGCYDFPAEQTNGWSNKMFVRADLMPHQIRITNVRVERLQDISDEDCIKEGIEFSHKAQSFYVKSDPTTGAQTWLGDTPREAYAALIDRISGKGTWERNPFVFVYEFELVK